MTDKLKKYPKIAKEGWFFIAISLILAIILNCYVSFLTALPFWVFFLFCLQFFRDPTRVSEGGVNDILSAADGRVISVLPAHDPWLDRDALKISVFMNVFNVHSNKSPVSGVVMERWYREGHFFSADLDKASEKNEANALHIRTANGHDITCVQIAGLIARRILCYVDKGSTLENGDRYGFIRFGSRVDLYLPMNAMPHVSVGDRVWATETILASCPEG